VNAIFTSHVEGLPREESDALLDLLYRQADVPEYQCRFRWEKKSVALWDNRSVQHYAAPDYDPAPRLMERVAIAGDAPR
jgi:taurine dioxygenase